MANMSDFDAEAAQPLRRPRCQLCRLLEDLQGSDKEKYDALSEALDRPFIWPDTGYTNTQIARVIQKWGHQIKDHTVARHRAGRCRGF